MISELTQTATEANVQLTTALQSLILAVHGMRVPPERPHASGVIRMEQWASKIEALAKVIEDETLYIKEGQR
jgi:hypothetical protein